MKSVTVIRYQCDPHASLLQNDIIVTENLALGFAPNDVAPCVIHIEEEDERSDLHSVTLDDILIRIDDRPCAQMTAADLTKLFKDSLKGYRLLEFRKPELQNRSSVGSERREQKQPLILRPAARPEPREHSSSSSREGKYRTQRRQPLSPTKAPIV